MYYSNDIKASSLQYTATHHFQPVRNPSDVPVRPPHTHTLNVRNNSRPGVSSAQRSVLKCVGCNLFGVELNDTLALLVGYIMASMLTADVLERNRILQ